MPLSGIRIVDLTRILAGPFCTMILGDMGAEVIKVETPGVGDPLRGQGVIKDGLSWYFAAFNRNKRSLSLNLREPVGGRNRRVARGKGSVAARPSPQPSPPRGAREFLPKRRAAGRQCHRLTSCAVQYQASGAVSFGERIIPWPGASTSRHSR